MRYGGEKKTLASFWPENFDQRILTSIVDANGVSHASIWDTVQGISLAANEIST